MDNSKRKVVYIYSKELEEQCNRLPTMANRASIVQDLITSYNLLTNDKITPIPNEIATEDDLKTFHSTTYVEFLKKVNNYDDLDEFEEEQLEYGLCYDCPILENIYDFAQTIAGASLTAAKLLNSKECDVAINWFGGWHHAQRDEAEGFCYINDIVIAIQKLTEVYNKILYVDLDIHHGNGVQNAFEFSNKILTLSFHKHEPGFYPGSGTLDEIGSGRGKYHSINVPFLSGVGHNSYTRVFNEVFPQVVKAFGPKAIVVQCGADSLNGDPTGESNLILETIGDCVRKVLSCGLPTMFLGGGGYNFANTARLWTYLTSIILNCDLPNDIPDDAEYFLSYGPSYELRIDASLQKDLNTEDYFNYVTKTISEYCSFIEL